MYPMQRSYYLRKYTHQKEMYISSWKGQHWFSWVLHSLVLIMFLLLANFKRMVLHSKKTNMQLLQTVKSSSITATLHDIFLHLCVLGVFQSVSYKNNNPLV